MCRRCWHGRWIGVVFMILVALVGLTLGVGKSPQVNDPAIDMPRWAQAVLGMVWFGAFFVFAAGTSDSRFHVVFDGVNLRYSFQDAWRAADFASDNGARIEKEPAPKPRAADGHDPDGVDHTGLHADSLDAND